MSSSSGAFTEEQEQKLQLAEKIVGHHFKDKQVLLSAITHPSAIEGKPVKFSYERLEFLGDAILGAIVVDIAFHRYPEMDEGGLTRIKVALVSGASLAALAQSLGFEEIIVFGSSETGTGKRGLHSALENVYEAIVGALYLDSGMEGARAFVERTLIPKMSEELSLEPENPKSALQEKLQEDGITPTYKLVETQGPPHDRTFVSQVYAGDHALARGTGRTKKEAESQAAKSTLARLGEFFGIEFANDVEAKQKKKEASKRAKEERAAAKAKREEDARTKKAANKAAKAARAQEKLEAKQAREDAKWRAYDSKWNDPE